MNIKHILVAGLVALGLGLAAILPGVSDGQHAISPAKDSPTAWAVAGSKPGVSGGSGITVLGGKAGGVVGSRELERP
jgi:hypothetical protein